MESNATIRLRARRILRDIDLTAIRREIAANADAWDYDISRQTKVKVQRETKNIFLRAGHRPIPDGIDRNDWHPSSATKMSHNFPDTVAWLDVAAATLGAKVARATLVALQPQGRVYRHVDGGEYYKVRDRYHLVIWSPGGSRMVWDEETVTFHEGELWWFDNKAPHQAFNDTDDARTHLIFDVTPPLYAHLDEVP